MSKRWWLFGLVVLSLSLAAFGPPLQTSLTAPTIAVDAGYDGNFRENQWMPIYIRASNDGPDVEGQLIVRPERSNNAVNNSYSVPISLPTGSRKTVFLYITARSFATQVVVELIDNQGVVVTTEAANVRALQPRDQLAVVVSQSPSGTVDLTGIHDGSYSGFQANWIVENIPDRAIALAAIDTLMFSDIDSGQLSTAQRQAITEWVAAGGHLIVTGGPNWQSTAAGLSGLLPFQPNSSTTLTDLSGLAQWLRFREDTLEQQAIIATGQLQANADVLVWGAGDLPLLIRHSIGGGTVDYLTPDPNAAPLRGWGGLTPLWLTLATSLHSRPSWSFGVTDWEMVNNSVNVLPGVDVLPDILPLCGFLAAYIALIGPLNYFVLNRINRREWAWVSIPLFIILFSALAWILGFNLRGSEVTLSRLTVVQSWPDVERAQVNQFIGLLSPRRAQYSLSVSDESFLRPIPRLNVGGALLVGNVQASTNIQQSEQFVAANFPVDASFIAAFDASTTVSTPDVRGQASLSRDASGQQVLRGSVQNDTPYTLSDPVILARGVALHLEEALEPGGVVTFDLTLSGASLPSPAPLAHAAGGFTSVFARSYSYINNIALNVRDILGDQLDNSNLYFECGSSDALQQERCRRRLFLAALMEDPFKVLTGRGNHVYLAAWTSESPLGIELEGASWNALDTTLYLAQIDVNLTQPTGEAHITADQFSWFVPERNTLNDVAPLDMALQSGDEFALRFTPLPGSVLRQVSELHVIMDRNSSSNRTMPIQIWNWEQGIWEDTRIPSGQQLIIRDPAPYLGPENSVQIKLIADVIGSFPRIQDLTVEQLGRF
ncbi:MAG: hypothetical protein JNJ61_00710 [Anaerolineae bacterium]|nr:hypothetical protein [Anaerolineae bacterium]